MSSYIFRDAVTKDSAVEALGEVVILLVKATKYHDDQELMYSILSRVMHERVLPNE